MQPEIRPSTDSAEDQATQLARELDTTEGLERISREAYEFIHGRPQAEGEQDSTP
ncbi:MAG: hypothetical protein AAFZ92_02120 [Pseudomonadota bacterium]